MKQVLLKILEILRVVWNAALQFASWVIAFLRSVNIDQPRGVILCLTFQLVVVISMVLAFRNPPGPAAKPREGQSQPLTSPEVTESSEPEMVLPLASPSENQ